jgi:hypothetical protein
MTIKKTQPTTQFEDVSKVTGISLEIEDYDKLYERTSDESILLNKFNMKDENDAARLDRLLMTVYQNDSIETVPSCECKALTKQANINVMCLNCGTTCIPATERPMVAQLWARVPDGVNGFISPTVWNIITQMIVRSKTSVIQWMVDPLYKSPNPHLIERDPFFLDLVNNLKWKRSINHFIENFDQAMEYIFDYKPKFVKGTARKRLFLWEFIQENKHKFFPQYLPIPNKALFIAEKTPMGIYLDKAIHTALDAARTITSLNKAFIEPTQKVKENKTVKIVTQMAEFYKSFDRENLAQKPGILRHQVFGARFDFSGRGVITSISGPHHKEDLHLPWGMSVLMFKMALASKLYDIDYTPSEIEQTISLAVRRYDPLIDKLFNELIDEATSEDGEWIYEDTPDGVRIVFQRNPSLRRGSAQQLNLVKVKTDVNDPTISLSPLVLAEYNAD